MRQLQLVWPSLSCSTTFFSSQARSKYFILRIFINTRSGRLAKTRWSVCISKSQKILWVSFSATDAGLVVWLNYYYYGIRILETTSLCKLLVLDRDVLYWPSTEPSIKRCTCVNKRKKSGSRWTLGKNIGRCSGQSETGMLEWGPACRLKATALSDPRLTNLAKMRKKCCYGQEKNLGQYSSLSLSPLISHTQQNITLSRIKCESYIFVKKCIRSVLKSFIIIDYIYTYIFILRKWLYDRNTWK